ncbi:aldo/keto reductase [Acetonema longum DSM 6540]|uniref:Aldo/keto reductase n=2 Tax=Acetonema TaxID=2373 RepID=F7NG40_9FIRM|nr:aldo/keto reductase [Acetonema longum DSM 6540]
MEMRRLGRTDMKVTAISFGALPIQRCSMDEAGPVLHAALDAGINFFDTARAYTDSEAKIGRYISSRRKEYYLADKSMARTKAGILKDIDISLGNMKTDTIDLYQIHNIKEQKDLDAVLAPDGALEGLKAAQAAGKIRFIGVTGHSIPLLIQALRTNEFSTVQVPFNCIETGALEELFPLADSLDIGKIAMKPLGGGQITKTELALRFILAHNVVAIPGMDEVKHIEENLAPAKHFRPLTAVEQRELAEEAKTIGSNFCRRCGYCMPCAVNIDIPTTFIYHLQYVRYGMTDAIPQRYASLPAKASACIECGVCESRCPYDLPIRERMKKVAADLG